MFIVTKIIDGEKHYLKLTAYSDWYWVPQKEKVHYFSQHIDAKLVADAYGGTVETP